MRNFETKQEKILDAALKITIRNGSANVTIREVAKEAGVNIAAINYYFSSKEQMLIEMEKLFKDNFDEAFTVLDRTDIHGEEKLLAWLNSALAYAVHYPGIIVLLREKMILNADNPINAQMLEELVERVAQIRVLFNEVMGLPEESMELFTMFASTITWPFVVSPMIFGIDKAYEDEETRDNYFKYVLDFFKTKANNE